MNALLQQIAHWAAHRPRHPALEAGDTRLDYAELNAALQQLGQQLDALGAQRIALALDNGIDWALVDLAAQHAGRVLIPVPDFFSDAQRRHLLHSSGADLWIGDNPPAGADRSTPPLHTPCGALPCFRLSASAPELHPGTAKITFTSGSTGQPKGVCLSQQQSIRVAQSLADLLGPLALERHLALLPLPTLLENIAGLYVPLLLGATVVLPGGAERGLCGSSQLNPQQLAHCLNRTRPQSLILVPELLRVLLQLPLPDSLRFVAVGGARVDPALLEQAHRQGLPVYQGYGLSECASVVALNLPGANRRGCVGRPLPHVEVRLDAQGTLEVKGAAMLGYLGAEPLNANSWVPTDDLAGIDADGFVRIDGRRSNLQITAFGRNFSPEWVESLAQTQSAIARLVLFGDALAENIALVETLPGQEAALPAAIARINQELPDYARIHRYHRLEQSLASQGLLTANGRPRRRQIQTTYARLLQPAEPRTPAQECHS